MLQHCIMCINETLTDDDAGSLDSALRAEVLVQVRRGVRHVRVAHIPSQVLRKEHGPAGEQVFAEFTEQKCPSCACRAHSTSGPAQRTWTCSLHHIGH